MKIEEDKYSEGTYKYKKPVIDTSNIDIKIGTKLYIRDKFYGTITGETNNFYSITNEDKKLKEEAAGIIYEPCDFRKDSLKEKIKIGMLKIKED